MSERELATIRTIAEVRSIEGADKICAYRVDGWWVVDQVGRYNVGDLVVYLEVDSWVPHSIAPFLTKPDRDPMVYQEIQGQRLRTIRLKGQLSQGLLLPIDVHSAIKDADESNIGYGCTDILGILKWEKPMNAQLAGMAKGNFPSFIRKTDQPRIQNMTRQFQEWQEHGDRFECSEKMDGSSMTVYFRKEHDAEESFGVCSRNLDLKQTEGNSFWNTAIELDLINKLRDFGCNLAIQGELCGPGIQGNQYGFDRMRFFCYDIFDITYQTYLLPHDVITICTQLGIPMVPIISHSLGLDRGDMEACLEIAEGISTYGGKQREGLVFKHLTEPDVSFKCISNKWLMANE